MRPLLIATLICALAAPAAAGPAPRGGVAIGAEMLAGYTSSGSGVPTMGLSAWAGWLVKPRLAALGWGQVRLDKTLDGAISVGLGSRVWLPNAGRIYGELRGGFSEMETMRVRCNEDTGECESGHIPGATLGLAAGVELLHNRFTAIDVRAELAYARYNDPFWNGFQGVVGFAITLFPGPHP
jgi:hypothetical protein